MRLKLRTRGVSTDIATIIDDIAVESEMARVDVDIEVGPESVIERGIAASPESARSTAVIDHDIVTEMKIGSRGMLVSCNTIHCT